MRLRANDDGASSVEYAIVVVFIAIAASVGLITLGLFLYGVFLQGGAAVTSAETGT